ncbi:ROK family transcriptional regulator [Cellulomonas sp. HZM]|uniref:ROK family transcriptional regulator n=1 Tax=Cellulomonas sp. HZM TaxID=1454010 RepID=UPI00054F974E|nr:ROK family transcriptional regulator [Cellulomonas sp. HZM]
MRTTAARQASLREHNLGLVLGHVVDAVTRGRTPSRADVAAATGLTRATVSALVDRLVAGGLLAELDPVQTQRAGRPAVPLTMPARTVAALGAEINVDYLGARVVDLSGDVVAERVDAGDFRASDPREVLARWAALAEAVLAEAGASDTGTSDVGTTSGAGPTRIAGAALALPGIVDRGTGPLRTAPNLGWRDVDVLALLADLSPTLSPTLAAHPPRLANEADLAARAESAARTAGADERPSFVYVSGEIGIGAAVVVDGRIFGGLRGWAGELGQTLVGDRRLEEVAGQDAMLRAAGLEPSGGMAALGTAARAGDERAAAAVCDAGTLLGTALANTVNLVDVSHVVLGGAFAAVADLVAAPVLAALERHVLAAPWAPPSVDAAVAGELPAMTGAALAVLADVVADPAAWLADDAPRVSG